MKKRVIDGIEVLQGSGNVYADVGLPDAEKHKVRADLAIQIIKAVRRLSLTQQDAAKRMGLTQPKVSDLMRGNFTNLSERKLMDCLNKLGYDIEIKIKPTGAGTTHPDRGSSTDAYRSDTEASASCLGGSRPTG